MLLPGILMYLPIGIGLILVYKFYNDKINKLVFNINLIFLGITFYYYYSFRIDSFFWRTIDAIDFNNSNVFVLIKYVFCFRNNNKSSIFTFVVEITRLSIKYLLLYKFL